VARPPFVRRCTPINLHAVNQQVEKFAMRLVVRLTVLLALSACASEAMAPSVRGATVALNPTRWIAHENDLTTPPPDSRLPTETPAPAPRSPQAMQPEARL
jgi:hypothetical protein